MSRSRHVPVLLDEVVAALGPRDGEVMVDGTFGGGGYSSALLSAANCSVYGIDRDPAALQRGAEIVARFPKRLTLIAGRFGEMQELLSARGVAAVDGVTLDVGVSSDQIDEAARGFSFQKDGPLDMRMGGEGTSAADVVNGYGEAAIADVLYLLGEERKSRAIAKAIIRARADAPITRTLALADLCERVLGRAHDGMHPATRTFQALRIYVNDELGELARGLSAAEYLLKPGGRLAVVSFHSLEDRMVKRFLAERSGQVARGSRHLPATAAPPTASFQLKPRNAITASKAEVARNPRARSAKLRAAVRTSAPAIPFDAVKAGVLPEIGA